MALLEGRGLTKQFGGILALKDVEFSIEEKEIVGLIGPNGAGKTTLFNTIAGAFKPSSGQTLFDGHDITGLTASRICRLGIARTFQVARPFPDMTCSENVRVAVINQEDRGAGEPWEAAVEKSLDFVGISEHGNTLARDLNLINKKRLELARALATRPKLLLLDEVLGGLNTQEIGLAVELIRKLRDEQGVAIFWIEHVMGAIMTATERVIVLDQGKTLMEGTPAEVVKDERVIKAYLGE